MDELIERNEEILGLMHTRLLEMESGSPEFREMVKDIQELTKVQAELKKYRPEFWLKVIGIVAPIAGTLGIYGTSIYVDNSEYIKPKVASSMERMITPWKK